MLNEIQSSNPSGSRSVPTRSAKTALLAGALMLGLAFASSPVNAASACKGLDNNACSESAACGWVESYERKDGRVVKAFCRTKAKGRTPATTKLQKNAATQGKVASN